MSRLGRLSRDEIKKIECELQFESKMVDKYIDMDMNSVSLDNEIQALSRQFEDKQSELRIYLDKTSSILKESDKIRIKIDVLKSLRDSK
jgi:hypothetical protein